VKRGARAHLAVATLVCAVLTWGVGAQTVVTVATWGDTGRYVEVLAEQYRETNPDVTLNVVEWGAPEEFRNGVLTQIAAGQTPDVVYSSSSTGLHWAPVGLLEPINAFVEVERYDLSRIPPFALKSVDVYGDGTYWCMPFSAFTINFVFNADMFDEAGLAAPGPDWRWTDDFVEAAGALTRDTNGDGMPEVYGFSAGYHESHVAYGVLRSFGASVLDPSFRRPTFNSPEMSDFLHFWKDLVDRGVASPLPYRGGAFAVGGYGMTLWNLIPGNVTTVRWGLELMPLGPTGERFTYGDTNNWCIMAGSANKAEAWELVKFLAEESPKVWSDNGIRLPLYPYMDVREWTFAPNTPALREGTAPADLSVLFENQLSAENWPRPGEIALRGIWTVEVERVFRGEVSVGAALEEIQRLADVGLRTWWEGQAVIEWLPGT